MLKLLTQFYQTQTNKRLISEHTFLHACRTTKQRKDIINTEMSNVVSNIINDASDQACDAWAVLWWAWGRCGGAGGRQRREWWAGRSPRRHRALGGGGGGVEGR